MSTAFFGKRWDAPLVDAADQIPTPVGQPCFQCGELIEDGDRGLLRAVMRRSGGSIEPVHAECDIFGVLGHQNGICHCTGYDGSRESAKLLWTRIGEMRGRPLEQRQDDK